MKKVFYLSLLIVAVLVTSCKKESTAIKFENLKRVEFTDQGGTRIISEKKTGNTAYDKEKEKTRYEYLITVQHPYTIAPMSIVNETMSDIIYPGSIVRGDEFMNGKYAPVRMKNEFEPVELSVTLNGKDIKVSQSVLPVLSKVRQARNDLIAGQMNKIKGEFIPAVYSYDSHEITTEASFKRTLKIHANIQVIGGIAKADFDYNSSNSSSSKKKYVMIAFRQYLYNMAIDPKHYSQWIKGDIDTQDMGDYEPLYISSVDYGRTGYILVQTNESIEEATKTIKAALEVAIKWGKGGVNVEYDSKFKSLFKENRIKIKIVGGPAELAVGVNSPESFTKFIQLPKAEELIASSAPIAYKVRRLRDNTEVDVIDVYTESKIDFKDE